MKKIEFLLYYVNVNGQEVNVSDVEFINIEEDLTGRDLMTFAFEGEVRKSYVTSHLAED